MSTAPASAIYTGQVRHRRMTPREHAFTFPLFMAYLDLEEAPRLLRPWPLCSARRPALAWMRRADYLGDRATALDDAVRRRVHAETGRVMTGPIRLLTHLRYFGHCFNPVSFYYCFDAGGERVETIVAEITNTPWKERHAYVLDVRSASGVRRWRFDKRFHVSPFMPMDMGYDWAFSEPGERLAVHMRLQRDGGRVFDATLALRRRPWSAAALARSLARFPLMTLQVVGRIHFEALRLWMKGTPVHPHPRRLSKDGRLPAGVGDRDAHAAHSAGGVAR